LTPERRHSQPGRRKADVDDFAKAALVEALAEDRLFPAWKKEDVIKWLTILTMAGGIAVAVITFFSTRFASRAEIEEQVKPVAQKLDVFAGSTNVRLKKIEDDREAEKSQDQATRLLISAMARRACIQDERDNSRSMSELAGLACDSLLNRRR
jgi:hypothetical protein